MSRWRSPATLWSMVFTAVLVVGGLFATEVPSTDSPPGVREAVQSQLQALAADDASRAFALAHPEVRNRFGTPEEFLKMVRAEYPMVHRPTSVVFLRPEAEGDLAFQKIRVTDSRGIPWLATYVLSRQQNNDWLISACLVVPDAARVTA